MRINLLMPFFTYFMREAKPFLTKMAGEVRLNPLSIISHIVPLEGYTCYSRFA